MFDCLVVGAGVSAIAAARVLAKNNSVLTLGAVLLSQ